jgi:hypothetical protein
MKDQVFKMYEQLQIGRNQICQICRSKADLEIPLSFYHIGENFNDDQDNVVFIGKTAVGGANFGENYKGDYQTDLFTDATNFGIQSLKLNEKWSKSRPFYNYTNEIIGSYFDNIEIGLSKSAMTNIVKCNNASTQDETPQIIKSQCINELGIIWKEIELMNATRVVFYTHNKYDEFIDQYKPENTIDFQDILDKKHHVNVGAKQMPWWHRQFMLSDGSTKHFLRVGHPERKNRTEFVSYVVDWLKQTKP